MTEQAQPPTHSTSPTSTTEDPSDLKMTPSMIESLSATKPWTLLLAILGFVSVFFMALGGIFSFIGFSQMPHHGAGAPFPFFFMAFGYLLAGILYFIPSYLLLKYAISLGRFLDGDGQQAGEQAFSYQKSFWKFIGILAVISIGIAILAIASAIIIPMVAHFNH
jgi:uncharacterized membrane protein